MITERCQHCGSAEDKQDMSFISFSFGTQLWCHKCTMRLNYQKSIRTAAKHGLPRAMGPSVHRRTRVEVIQHLSDGTPVHCSKSGYITAKWVRPADRKEIKMTDGKREFAKVRRTVRRKRRRQLGYRLWK